MTAILACKCLVFVLGGLLAYGCAKLVKANKATFPRALAISVLCLVAATAWPVVTAYAHPVWCGGVMVLLVMVLSTAFVSTTLLRGTLICLLTSIGLGFGWIAIKLGEQWAIQSGMLMRLEELMHNVPLKG